jgi:hypothetical protein
MENDSTNMRESDYITSLITKHDSERVISTKSVISCTQRQKKRNDPFVY